MPANPFDLSGRLAVVTGCRRGIGLAMAEALAAAGADIVGVSAHLEHEGSEVQRRVELMGRWFKGYRVDFASGASVLKLATEVAHLERPVDILVNNAGIVSRAAAEVQSESGWHHVLQVNLTSHFLLAREIGRTMLERGRGKVIFTASLLSFQGGINVAGYAAAKSGIAGLTRALANEWAARGVNVNGVAPGYIATDSTRALQDDPIRSRAILERIPAGRWGRPEDIGGVTVFLAAPASDYVSGVIVPVDGGWLAR